MSAQRVNDIGRGRVWTGAQAQDNGLVDELGGFTAAIQAAKKAAGIEPTQEVELAYYPKAKPLLERIGELLSTRVALELPRSWQQALHALALPFDAGTGLTMMPESVEIR